MANLNDTERSKLLSMLKHDMNNVLTGVKTGVEILAMDDYFEDPDNAEDLNDVLRASKRLSYMIDDLSLIFADQSLPGQAFPSISISELKDTFLRQCEDNRLYPISEDPVPEGSISIATPILCRGLLYLTQALHDMTRQQIEFNFSRSEHQLQITFLCIGTHEDKLKELIELKDESHMNHVITMVRQAIFGLKGQLEVKGDRVYCTIPIGN